MAEVMGTTDKAKKLAESAGLRVPENPDGKIRWRKLVEKSARDLGIGKSLRAFRFAESNAWINPHDQGFGEADFITGMSLRAETYPCKAVLARGRNATDILCRHCHQTAETVGHISGACWKVKDYRIKRHNAIVNSVAEKCKAAGWMVTHEPSIPDSEGNRYKPDLIMVQGAQAWVLDPTVVYENGQSLQLANAAKVKKYETIEEQVKEKFGVGKVQFAGLAIGARGGWCDQNTTTLERLGITQKGFRSHLCRLALKGTMNMLRLFMDG